MAWRKSSRQSAAMRMAANGIGVAPYLNHGCNQWPMINDK
jgi:hypothetical protein